MVEIDEPGPVARPVPEAPEALPSAVEDEGAHLQVPAAFVRPAPAGLLDASAFAALAHQLQELGNRTTPPLLSQNWEQARDLASGMPYYFNRGTGETRWLPGGDG